MIWGSATKSYTAMMTALIIKIMIFDKTTMVTNTIAAMRKKLKPIVKPEDSKYCIPSEQFETRLNLLK